MASQPPKNEAFLREVDEELRRDQIAEFGRRYGIVVVVVLVLVLAGIGGAFYWRYHKQQVAGTQGETFQSALDTLGDNDVKQAAKPLDTLAGSKIDGYRAMARFTQADVLLQKNDLKGAAAKFAEIANDQSLAQPFRDLALIRQTAAQFDQMKPQAVVDRLRGLAVKSSPWFGSAGEMVAIAYMKMNRRDLAQKMFADIAEEESVPESLRQRAVQMAGVLGTGPSEQNEDKPKQ